MSLDHLSTPTIEARIRRIDSLRQADKRRLEPNPNGPGFLTRDERWRECLLVYIRALQNRWRMV